MVSKLFDGSKPTSRETLLDPGCGEGAFIEGVLRFCKIHQRLPPAITGIELNPALVDVAKERLHGQKNVRIVQADFLFHSFPEFDYVIGNPPYVPITGLSLEERRRYRANYATAVERFDLYLLFFERSLKLLAPNGRLCFITPEKFEYVHSATPLRRLLANYTVEEVDHVSEDTFPGLVTYPTITTVVGRSPARGYETHFALRDRKTVKVRLPKDGSSWNPVINQAGPSEPPEFTLQQLCLRVSCGIATGADSMYVHAETSLPGLLKDFAYPTIAGRQLGPYGPTRVHTSNVMLIPYDMDGNLLPEGKMGPLLTFLSRPDIARHLKERTCVTLGGRQWYRFHDNAPLRDILRPKILCKDITQEPHFWADREGTLVPRHTVYYMVPKDGVDLDMLLAYLNSDEAVSWLKANCQRAANGFYRVQSSALKLLPVPGELMPPSVRQQKANRGRSDRLSPRAIRQTLITANA
jgi:hypothetical protein